MVEEQKSFEDSMAQANVREMILNRREMKNDLRECEEDEDFIGCNSDIKLKCTCDKITLRKAMVQWNYDLQIIRKRCKRYVRIRLKRRNYNAAPLHRGRMLICCKRCTIHL